MARPSNTEERRGEIVDGLIRVMARVGFERATTAAIARAAGLSPGLVHYHFATKHDVLLALVPALAARVRARVAARQARAPDQPRARAHAFLDAHVELGPDADPDAVRCWVAVGAEALERPAVRAAYRRVVAAQLDQLEPLIVAWLRAEGRDPGGARTVAVGLLAAVEGAYRLAIAAPSAAPPGFAAPTLRHMADGLVAAEPRARR